MEGKELHADAHPPPAVLVQGAQPAASALAVVPAGQVEQAACPTRDTLPDRHGTQEAAPPAAAVPARHVVAAVPSQAEPGGQATQVLRFAGTCMYCPDNLHDLAPITQAALLEDPGGALGASSGHLVQLKEPGDSA